jgi:hypothetical protein
MPALIKLLISAGIVVEPLFSISLRAQPSKTEAITNGPSVTLSLYGDKLSQIIQSKVCPARIEISNFAIWVWTEAIAITVRSLELILKGAAALRVRRVPLLAALRIHA